MIVHNKIYLASRSPRRRELLRQIGVQYSLITLSDTSKNAVTEKILPDETPSNYVTRVTREKVIAAQNFVQKNSLPVLPILTADTTVTLNGKIFGKPNNEDEAKAMLRELSNRTHQVLTSVALLFDKEIEQITQISEVTFTILDEETINRYCASREPYDKAGGYGIQGHAATFITHISGSYSGIMGLPLYETAKLLNNAGFVLP